MKELSEKIKKEAKVSIDEVETKLPVGFTKEMLLSQTKDKNLKKQL